MSFEDCFDELELWRALYRHGVVEKSTHELSSPEINTLRYVIEDLLQSAGFANKAELQQGRLHNLHEDIENAEKDLALVSNDFKVELAKLTTLQKKIEEEHAWLAKCGFPVADRAFAEAEQALKRR